ncbi:hypothetical protein COU36_00260, partial [Candidatus Micrarchaeota archaeon CG10_big_fil_rev_8_21_14_0_10_59_7]
ARAISRVINAPAAEKRKLSKN